LSPISETERKAPLSKVLAMWVWVDRLGGVVLDATLATTALLSLVAVGMLGCRQPARRAGLARSAIFGALALVPLVGLALVPRCDVIGLLRSVGLPRHPLLASWRAPVAHAPEGDAEPAASPPVPLSWIVERSWSGRWPARVLTLFYVTGVALGLAWLVLGYWGLGWLIRRSIEPSDATRALYESLPYRGRGRRPRLRVSPRVRRPVLAGLLRPTILVPLHLDLPEEAEPLRLSLLHELAHAEQGDSWFSLVSSLAQAFWFFLPPLWWIRAQMRLDHEFLADHQAASALGARPNYAASLLDLAAPHTETVPVKGPAAPAIQGTGSALFLRVLMLVRCPFPVERRPPAWWCWSLPSLIALGTLAISTLTFRLSRPDPGANPGPPAARGLSSAQGKGPQTFRVARLTVDPQRANAHGRAPLVELPIRLSEAFELTLSVWGDRETVSASRVAGFRLGPIDPGRKRVDVPDLPCWHVVRLRREDHRVSLWLDDQPIPTPPEPAVPTTWLSVEPPPDTSGYYQNIRLSW
jgi:hypothetical protein